MIPIPFEDNPRIKKILDTDETPAKKAGKIRSVLVDFAAMATDGRIDYTKIMRTNRIEQILREREMEAGR